MSASIGFLAGKKKKNALDISCGGPYNTGRTTGGIIMMYNSEDAVYEAYGEALLDMWGDPIVSPMQCPECLAWDIAAQHGGDVIAAQEVVPISCVSCEQVAEKKKEIA